MDEDEVSAEEAGQGRALQALRRRSRASGAQQSPFKVPVSE